MLVVKILIYILGAGFVAYWVHLMVKCIGRFARRNVPFVPSYSGLRDLVVAEINTHYSDAKYICEMGAGYGALARKIARETGGRVIALENVPYYAGVSKIMDVFVGKNVKTICTDAYKYLDRADKKFDVIVAYMGPECTARLHQYSHMANVIISMDFPMRDVPATRSVPLGRGATIYKGKRYPHMLYVYEFKDGDK